MKRTQYVVFCSYIYIYVYMKSKSLSGVNSIKQSESSYDTQLPLQKRLHWAVATHSCISIYTCILVIYVCIAGKSNMYIRAVTKTKANNYPSELCKSKHWNINNCSVGHFQSTINGGMLLTSNCCCHCCYGIRQ